VVSARWYSRRRWTGGGGKPLGYPYGAGANGDVSRGNIDHHPRQRRRGINRRRGLDVKDIELLVLRYEVEVLHRSPPWFDVGGRGARNAGAPPLVCVPCPGDVAIADDSAAPR
jgi:hypothetical protein